MSVHAVDHNDFSTTEWHRLNEIATKYESQMRLAYTRAMQSGIKINTLQLRKTIIDIVAATCLSSAETYGIVFNPNSSIYIDTVDRLTEKYVSVVESKDANEAVKRILPSGISLEDRRRRSNTFGLDTRSALEVEHYRQSVGDGVSQIRDTERVRVDAVNRRGNLLAVTETNRVVNAALEALWLDNQEISKAAAEVIYYDSTTISHINKLPRRARKIIVTRRDDRVCNYCDPLDGVKARLGEQFDTEYGLFVSPPIHPRCRCFLIVTTGA